ncbi:BQ5605_C001g00896 [Microbotryum silenes-dioicae]|uniref:BQ5605_C001g00896 protein n=1 Tax=Microbotryum silenes-dioicae TaxID=796604 RepID=A0A2X0P7B7_9BASI|nr:BQ5605_C001g00896 [Microbotryum silenes-dioicae]
MLTSGGKVEVRISLGTVRAQTNMRISNGWADPNCARDNMASSSRHLKGSSWKLCNDTGQVFSRNGCSMQYSYGLDNSLQHVLFECQPRVVFFTISWLWSRGVRLTIPWQILNGSVRWSDRRVGRWDPKQCLPVDESLFLIEYLQSLNIPGMALRAAKFKVGCPVMLLGNLDSAAGLCNGTRLLSTRSHTPVLEAIILTEDHAGQPVLLPRITLKTGSSAELPFTLHRTQFPIRLAMAMTFNKLQGQSLAQQLMWTVSEFCFIGLRTEKRIM